MHLRIFPQQAPKPVENFIGHARSGYHDGVIFNYRVILEFMVQTGDPLGDGMGGTSTWDYEFSDDLKHDRYVYREYGKRRSKCEQIGRAHV